MCSVPAAAAAHLVHVPQQALHLVQVTSQHDGSHSGAGLHLGQARSVAPQRILEGLGVLLGRGRQDTAGQLIS
jgi:hypothetical protein